jgi:hypothetical protein
MTSDEVEAVIDLINAAITYQTGKRWLKERGLQDSDAWVQNERAYRRQANELREVARAAELTKGAQP